VKLSFSNWNDSLQDIIFFYSFSIDDDLSAGTGNTYRGGRLSTMGILIKVDWFVNKKIIFSI